MLVKLRLMQELSVLIKADHPIDSVDLHENPIRLHKIYPRSFFDAQEFVLYKHIATTFPHLDDNVLDPDLPQAHRPSIRVSCFVARGQMYFVWNVFFILVGLGLSYMFNCSSLSSELVFSFISRIGIAANWNSAKCTRTLLIHSAVIGLLSKTTRKDIQGT